jgi:Fe-S-cluster containining protein
MPASSSLRPRLARVPDGLRPAAGGTGRVALCRTGDPAELARSFTARLRGVGGMRRALEAWALARDTLEGTLVARKVDEGACRKGCAWCCRLPVEIRFAEAAHLARRAGQDRVLERRVRETAARVGGMVGVERLRSAAPCAFLDPTTQACAVYEDRPLACRSFRSRDAGWCRGTIEAARGAGPPPCGDPVVREALGIRAMVQTAMVEVTPPEWRAMGELHAMVVRVLDAVGRGTGRPTATGPLTPPDAAP